MEELKPFFDPEQLLPEHGGTSEYKFDPYQDYQGL
jgi:hypothetical protein